MSPHLSTERAEAYRERVLPEAELLAVDDHLATCEECRQRIEASVEIGAVVLDFHRRLTSDVRPLESDHLSYEQLVSLVDGELKPNESEALHFHLEVCESCTEEVNHLRAFRTELVGSTMEETARAVEPKLVEKIRSLIKVQLLPSRPALAGAFALVLIAALVALFLAWRASRRQPPAFQATSPVPEVSTSPNVATAPSPQQESTPDERFVVMLNDGGMRVTVDANGNVDGLGPLPSASSQAVRRALTTGQVEVPELSELLGVKGRLLGPTNDGVAFSLLSPVGIVTRNARPTLRWQPLSEATSYTVAILDGSYNVVTTSPPLRTTSWTPSVPLTRGRVYSWQVTALRDGKEIVSPSSPAPEARFKVLDKTMADELSNAEKLSGSSHLVRGTLYAKAGLLNEAEQEIRALIAANPESERARQLLQSIRALKSRYKTPD